MKLPPKEPPVTKRPSRKCVFCGNGKLSKEHIWSEWARDLLPASDGYLEVSHRNRGGKPVDHRIIRDAEGAITNKKLRRVCKPCNNVWMGRQEEEAKAVVSDLITGTPLMLTKGDRALLVNWIITKMMVLDVMRDGEHAFTDDERAAFYAHWTPPQSLSVWLLRCGDSSWKTLFWSHARRVTVVVDDTWENAKPPSGSSPNLKLFLWGVGEALFVAAYARELNIDLGMQDEYAIRLLPDQGMARAWPPRTITAQEASDLQHTLPNISASLGAREIELGDDGEPIK